MGTTRNTCGLSYSRGLKGCWRRVSPRCSSYSSSSPWSRELLMCQAPLVLLGQIMSFSQVTTVCVCIFFFSVTIFIFSQGKALPVVPLRNLCARSSPSRFPRLPQVQGWHWRMWWLSQLAWDGGSICFDVTINFPSPNILLLFIVCSSFPPRTKYFPSSNIFLLSKRYFIDSTSATKIRAWDFFTVYSSLTN